MINTEDLVMNNGRIDWFSEIATRLRDYSEGECGAAAMKYSARRKKPQIL